MLEHMTNKPALVPAVCAFGLVLLLADAGAQAADYYVATSGSDSNPGTAAQPFRTITRAYTYAAAGVVIHVAPGVYTDYTSGWGIHLGKSGTASSPIVLESQVVGGAIIEGQNTSDRNEGFYIDGNYNIVDGFEVRNCPSGGFALYGSGNQILNNHIHHNGNPASTSTNGKDGVYSNEGTSGNYYLANSIHDNGRSGSNLDHGLYLCGQNEIVINNLLFRNAASGLQIAGYTTVANMEVYNNVMAWNGTSGIIVWMTVNGIDIRNNIIYNNGHNGVIFYAATGSGVVLDHNLCYGNAWGNYDFASGGSTASYTLGTSITADPAFVNDSSASFNPHLGSGSPCIQAGLNLSSVFTTDKDGAARPASGSWDLGGYVYATANTPPSISSIANQTITAGASTGPLAFTVSDAQTAAGSLTVSANSSNPTLVPNANISLGGSAANRTVKITAAPNQSGTATVSLQVSDGQATASRSFLVTVNPAVKPTTLRLTLQNSNLQLRWATNTGSYILQERILTSSGASWTDVTNAPVIAGTNYLVSRPVTGAGTCYRLRNR